ncbi:phosphatidylethanolamine binding protein [Trichuris trichiura]|uniref:Phosphatidylethanolamine binding protein n=1 Tax=Trichuris trichiura TaxID=36087 RepID=A0A077Z8P7_TRITR|nr:phosphatidylethanolamine binding protein [Trichuris trichiura]
MKIQLRRSLPIFFLLSKIYSSADLDAAFINYGVIPDVIDKAPRQLLKVVFDESVNCTLGNILTPSDVRHAPHVLTWNAYMNQLYTLLMTDPDAPSRDNPINREFLHWLVVNIPMNHISSGDTVAQYVGSGPPQGTGLHRYVFTVYLQKSRLFPNPEACFDKIARRKWSTRNFAEENYLGQPEAGNFFQVFYFYLNCFHNGKANLFQAEYDDHVPAVQEQLNQLCQ